MTDKNSRILHSDIKHVDSEISAMIQQEKASRSKPVTQNLESFPMINGDKTYRKDNMTDKNNRSLHCDITHVDSEIADIVKQEKERQCKGLELIAAQNFTSKAVTQALGSCLMNDGDKTHRSDNMDKIEKICQKRALELFKLNPKEWGVNVHSLSGSIANLVAYTAIAGPRGRIMGLDLYDGGHYSHGYHGNNEESNAASIMSLFFDTYSYKLNPTTGYIDYDELRRTAKVVKPNLIVAGTSWYSRDVDYRRFKEICDDVGAYLLGDMAHVCGLVAAGVAPNPFDFCDIVTTTTYKSLRGPRAGLIFYRKGMQKIIKNQTIRSVDLEKKINETVYPGLHGGSHNNQVAGIAVSLKEAMSPEFILYQKQVLANAKTLCKEMQARGYRIATGGTDNHMIIVELDTCKINATQAAIVLEDVGIYVNKKHRPCDTDKTKPSGLRIGSPALTSRNFKEHHFIRVADFVDRAIKIAEHMAEVCGGTEEECKEELCQNSTIQANLKDLRTEIENFAMQFPMPGIKGW